MSVPVAVRSVEDPVQESAAEGVDSGVDAAGNAFRRRRGSLQVSVVIVVVIGLLITSVLSLGALALHNSNENRLLRQRVREAGAVITAAVPTIRTPLASAAVLAESTGGNVKLFRGLMEPIVKIGSPFISASLWSTKTGTRRPMAVVGSQPTLASEPSAAIDKVLERAKSSSTVTINNLLAARNRRLGYAFVLPSPTAGFMVYGEAALPRDRRANVERNDAFADLGYALYIGRRADPRFLLASSTGGDVLHGRTASVTVPFGDAQLHVVMTPHKELGGPLLANLWWMLALLGVVITAGAGLLVSRLTSRRTDAEALALENARLYAQQRTVAQTLQHSLLAEAFPQIGGLEFAASYVAGVEGIDIGGDWYDVVRLDGGNILLVVGDVSGRGLEAATMMASLRYAARAYAAENHPPGVILSKLSALVSIARDGHFATVLCGMLDVANGRIRVANAGHPEPLLIGASGAEFIATSVGVPVGVHVDDPYPEVEFAFSRGSTLLLYTDGAIERRGEHLDIGLQRLKDVSLGAVGTLDAILTQVAEGVVGAQAEDDTALLGIRWKE